MIKLPEIAMTQKIIFAISKLKYSNMSILPTSKHTTHTPEKILLTYHNRKKTNYATSVSISFRSSANFRPCILFASEIWLKGSVPNRKGCSQQVVNSFVRFPPWHASTSANDPPQHVTHCFLIIFRSSVFVVI
mgnify:CR=1 FL=1